MKRSWALGLLLAAGCYGKPAADVLQIQDIVPPTAAPTCTVDATSPLFRSRGFIDISRPAGVANLGGYVAAVRMRNMTQVTNVSKDQVFAQYNDIGLNNTNINVDGINLCYETDRVDDALPKDPAPGCNQLKGVTKGYSPGTALVTPASPNIIVVDLLPPGVVTDLALSIPANSEQVVAVHVQATGHNAAGDTVVSNEMIFPLHVCNGCLFQDASLCPKVDGKPVYDTAKACLPGQDDFVPCAAAAP